ncbi:hypothetical protein DFJ58DRAFT_836040 [Suillus subalutaceus]|uniref:uncharacterized protein n=1 Tax=Suillus subalutaceus TaxID=48586 RepID=UPI001B87430D|nr:uncharacterized protein DFJ58DRAFT_836040 [Suillus subalutaceus]KAG1875405.1 hypothetical protein DFJ58DRAFT_836040 [Suillus subalutaceus]
MQPNIFTPAARQVTKLTDKTKVALEERLEATGLSKKYKIDVKGTSAVSNNSKKAKQNPPTDISKDRPVTGTSKDRPVAKASSPPPDVGTAAKPCEICCAIVHTEEEEEVLYDNAIVIDDKSEKSRGEAGNEASSPESAEDNAVQKGCKATIQWFLDKKDAQLMGNMHKHVKSCWRKDMLNAADDTKDVDEVRTKIIGGILKNRSIMASFKCKGKEKGRNSVLGIGESASIQDSQGLRISVIDEDQKARVLHTFAIHNFM